MADPTSITNPPGVTGSPPLQPAAPPSGFVPYIADRLHLHEFTFQAVLVGAILGIVFGASSLYLVLRIGLTVSASIPVAVLSITLFRALSKVFGFRKATILENNITQTAGSAGESIAFGVGVTMPALMLVGFEMTLERIMVVSILGGLLGILMMIPLRRAFIVNMHGKPGQPNTLLYPEGTACAAVLISGEKGGTSGATVFIGFGVAFVHKFLTETMTLLRGTISVPLGFFSPAAKVAGDMASELLGVGYILGARIGSIMMAGAVMGWLVVIPAIYLEGAKTGVDPESVYKHYLRHIGAGCVAAAGIISMIRSLPMIVRSLLGKRRVGADVAGEGRTERDLPPSVVLGGSVLLLVVLSLLLMGEVGWFPAVFASLLVLLFGFLFVTVSSRLTGEVGSSSNPISGMTIATLLLTCLIFLALGWRSPTDAVLALSIGAVVCIAASNGGTTSQDLKTGFLVGATPLYQQLAIVVGALSSAVVIGYTLMVFNDAGIVYSQRNLPPENVAAELEGVKEKETPKGKEFSGEEFFVYRPAKDKKYLADAAGNVVYLVDPTITGTIKTRDFLDETALPGRIATKEEVANLKDPFARREGGKMVVYHLFTREEPLTEKDYEEGADRKEKVKKVEYLIDPEGKATARIDPQPVKMKFAAPKTEVMGIIINGLLDQKLNWALVLIGAFLAVALELCGVSSLAFAVGVYVPMSVSAPIFFGGLLRWGVDAYQARGSRGAAHLSESEEIAKTETSSGVLLASGFIAGGSLAGVLGAFIQLPFFETIKKAIDFGRPAFKPKGDPEPYYSWMADASRHTFGDLDYLALIAFGLLAVFLALVGMGKLLPTKPEEKGIPR
jgi:putative OPT family oligopeptide transporter